LAQQRWACFLRSVSAPPSPRERTVEESLDAINRLPAAERAAALAEGAKKERELVWYSTMNAETRSSSRRRSRKTHPYISVKL
jgi:hypothetical protein